MPGSLSSLLWLALGAFAIRHRRLYDRRIVRALNDAATSSGRGDFARGLYIENDLPFRR